MTRVNKAIRDDSWWRVDWWRFGGGEITLGGEFTGGESSWWRGDHKPNIQTSACVCGVSSDLYYR